jgi:8-hydroxy-5-deazaflavin:NADPH oxidoreductase
MFKRIGIVGAGRIGQALAVRFADASLPGDVRAGTVPEAARFGELVAVAIPPAAILDLPPEPFAGRIVIDANNYYPEPGARVVKAFNTIYFMRLLDDSRPDLPAEDRLAVPVAGDDAEAKRAVLDLVDRIGFAGVDAGSLADSRRQQPGSRVWEAFAEARRREEVLTVGRLRELLAAARR